MDARDGTNNDGGHEETSSCVHQPEVAGPASGPGGHGETEGQHAAVLGQFDPANLQTARTAGIDVDAFLTWLDEWNETPNRGKAIHTRIPEDEILFAGFFLGIVCAVYVLGGAVLRITQFFGG
jgi:hypothetical protein